MPSLVAGLQKSKGPSIVQLEVTSIDRDPSQPRTEFDEGSLRELAESIKSEGLIQPIVVRNNPGAFGRYLIVAGERRWRACKLLEQSHILAILRPEEGANDVTLVENLQREDLSLGDQIALVARLVEERGGPAAAAAAVQKPMKWITERSRLAGAPEWLLTFARSGASSDATALYDLARLADAEPEIARRLVDEYEEGDSLRTLVRNAVKVAKAPPPSPSGSIGESVASSEDVPASSWETREVESLVGEDRSVGGGYDREERGSAAQRKASSSSASERSGGRSHADDADERTSGSTESISDEEPSVVPVAAKSIEADVDASCLLVKTKDAVFRIALSKRLKIEMQKALAQL